MHDVRTLIGITIKKDKNWEDYLKIIHERRTENRNKEAFVSLISFSIPHSSKSMMCSSFDTVNIMVVNQQEIEMGGNLLLL